MKLVDEFIKNYIDNDSIFNELQSMCDIPRVISKISTNKSNPKDLIDLSNSLSSILIIKRNISKNKIIHKLFKEIVNPNINEFPRFTTKLKQAIFASGEGSNFETIINIILLILIVQIFAKFLFIQIYFVHQ